MRFYILSFLLLCLFALNQSALAQTDSVSKATLEEILTRLKNIEKEEIQKIGYLSYNADKTYSIYKKNTVIKRVLIDSIILTCSDGFIVDINIYANNKRFVNKQAPIALTLSRFGGEDNLFGIGSATDETMVAQEILSLSLDNNFIPEDGKIVLNKDTRSSTLQRNVGVNTIIDARIYTDMLGTFGAESNGLAQTDIKYKQILHRHNLWNRGCFFFQYFKINLNLSKLDSKYASTDSIDYSRSKVLQRGFVNTELAFNLFNGWLFEKKSAHKYYLDFGSGVNLTRLSKKDSLIKEISTPYWFFEAGINSKFSDNIGADIQLKCIDSYLPSNSFTTDKGYERFIKLGVEIYYNPMGDKPSRVFVRANYYCPSKTGDQQNAFFQVQAGYSILLSKLINQK